jgi:hypothetical protein
MSFFMNLQLSFLLDMVNEQQERVTLPSSPTTPTGKPPLLETGKK